MKLYVLSGPKETRRICLCWIQKDSRILSHDQACLMHAEEVDGRWS